MTTNKQEKRVEIYDFFYNNIKIIVKIDYLKNVISLLDNDLRPKNYIFTDRGVEYMNGWIEVLNGMKAAIEDAKKKYENNLAEISKFRDEQLEKIAISLERSKGSIAPTYKTPKGRKQSYYRDSKGL